ncbi:MAG: carboxymuconolactone decarboxylase family protein [Gulosibacter sp.]|uniref:carboxymuconolactone decarboxylase family protein n=1 Tax=Gulosibacter sp. TaxID=2817531 RepID=UPI003F929AAD
MTEPRINPIPSSEWSDAMWDAIAVIGAKRPAPEVPPTPTPNILGIYANHPQLVTGWMPFSSHLKHSSLSSRVREICIIRTTWLGGGEYEWAQHRKLGIQAGLTASEIAALSDGVTVESEAEVDPATVSWSREDALIIRAIDEILSDRNVSDDTWVELSAILSEPQLIDLVFMVTTYDMHCVAFNTLGLQLDAGLEGFPTSHPRGGADKGAPSVSMR